MLISEIFHSIQGEGSLAGMPSVFIRTSGCNLRCAWCDTPYASWNPEGAEMSNSEILAEVSRYPARHIVLTGGEPMIARGIRELATALHASGYHITIETAGTVHPAGISCDLASVSPKFANSTPPASEAGDAWVRRHESTRWNPDALAQWFALPDVQCKLVVASAQEAADSLAALHAALPDFPRHRIFLMPEGTDPQTLRSRHWLVEFCLKEGYRFCDRLHIHLFGNTKGT